MIGTLIRAATKSATRKSTNGIRKAPAVINVAVRSGNKWRPINI